MSLIADVSGRHRGDGEVRAFVGAVLGKFRGVAQDEYTDHCWTAEEVLSKRKVRGHAFFDYRRGSRRRRG